MLKQILLGMQLPIHEFNSTSKASFNFGNNKYNVTSYISLYVRSGIEESYVMLPACERIFREEKTNNVFQLQIINKPCHDNAFLVVTSALTRDFPIFIFINES